MKYRVHLTKERHGREDSDGSSYLTDYVDGDDFIEWELLDNVCAKTFITSFNMVKDVDDSRANELSPASWIGWNRYQTGENTAVDWNNNINMLNQEVLYAKNNNHCNFTIDKHIIYPDIMDLDAILGICNAIHFEFENRLLDHKKQLEEAGAEVEVK